MAGCWHYGGMRLVIVEDNLLVREGLSHVLASAGHEVVGVAVRAEQVLGLVARQRPEVVLMDVRLPPTGTDEGIRLAGQIRERYPRIGVLVLSQHLEPAVAGILVRDGGERVGYILKDRVLEANTLNAALYRIAEGGTVIDEDLVTTLMSRSRRDDDLATLTDRERDVLALMAQGMSDRGIAARLSVSLPTVSSHVQNTYRKLAIPESTADNRRVSAVLAYLRRR